MTDQLGPVEVFYFEDDIYQIEYLSTLLNNIAGKINFNYFRTPKEFKKGLTRISEADLIFMDVDLGGVSGLTIVEEIRKSHINVFIAVMSSDDSNNVETQALRVGANCFVPKSIGPNFRGRIKVIFETVKNNKSAPDNFKCVSL